MQDAAVQARLLALKLLLLLPSHLVAGIKVKELVLGFILVLFQA